MTRILLRTHVRSMMFDMDNLNSEDEDDIIQEYMQAHSEQVRLRVFAHVCVQTLTNVVVKRTKHTHYARNQAHCVCI